MRVSDTHHAYPQYASWIADLQELEYCRNFGVSISESRMRKLMTPVCKLNLGRKGRISAVAGKIRPLCLTVRAEAKKAHITIEGSISEWEVSARNFKRSITELIDAGIIDAHVYINSGGGDVFQANEIVNEIKRFPGTITGEGGAIVASAATYISAHIVDFTMAENGSFMIHKPSGYFQGTADQIESELKLLRNLQANYLKKYAERTGLTESQVEKLWGSGDYWMSAQEALDQGFVSGITGATEISAELADELTAKGAPNVVATVRTANPISNKQTDNKVNELQIIALSMGLDVNSSAASVQAFIKALQDKANNFDVLKKQVDEAEKSRAQTEAAAKAKEFKAAFDAKVTAKAITEDFRAGYESKFSVNPVATLAEIESLKPVLNISDSLNGGVTPGISAERKDWKYEDWAAKDNAGLMAMAKNDLPGFKALYKAHYKSEPSDATIEAIVKG